MAKQAAIPPLPVRAPRIARVAKRKNPRVAKSSNADQSIGDMIGEAMQNIGSFVGL